MAGTLVRGVLDYIAAHYGEEDLSTAQIAEAFHFSPAYLNVLFKQEMKVTLKQYLSGYRLEKAKKLLEQDYMKITEIAEKCGYANANYFSKVFREGTGMTPLEYRPLFLCPEAGRCTIASAAGSAAMCTPL